MAIVLKIKHTTNKNASIEWPLHMVPHFYVLNEMYTHCQSLFIKNNKEKEEAIVIDTVSGEDTLIWMGAFVEWHVRNDQSFFEVSDQVQTLRGNTFFGKHSSVEDVVCDWVKTKRPVVAVQFDTHFVEAALDARPGLLGEIIQTAEFLDCPMLLAIIGFVLEHKLGDGKNENLTKAFSFCVQ